MDPSKRVFVDESGVNTAMTRSTRGRAARERCVEGAVPQGHWKTLTMIDAIRLDVAPRTTEALGVATEQAFARVTPADARGWFEHCRYRVH